MAKKAAKLQKENPAGICLTLLNKVTEIRRRDEGRFKDKRQ